MPQYSDYKKTDGDWDDEERHVVAGISWRLWLPIVFIILALIAIIIMQAIVLDSSVSKTSNQDLKNEIQKQCGDCGGGYGGKKLEDMFNKACKCEKSWTPEYDDSKHDDEHHGGDHGNHNCETEFKDYMNIRFQNVYKRMDKCGKERDSEDSSKDWSHYMHSSCSSSYGSMKKHFDQRIGYMYEVVEHGCSGGDGALWPAKDMWDVKDLKEYVGDKMDWIGGKLDLVVIQNHNENDVSNDVDVIINNANDIDIDIKTAVDSATSDIVQVLNGIIALITDVEQYLGMNANKRNSDDRNLRQFIGDGVQEIEDLISNQEPCVTIIENGGTDNDDGDDNNNKDTPKHWFSSGADLQNSKYSEDMHGINTKNVHTVSKRWTHNIAGRVGSSASPTTDGNVMFSTDFSGFVFSMSRDTGKLIWKRNVKDILGVTDADVVIVSRNSPTLHDDCRGQPCVILGAPGDRSAGGYTQFGGFFYDGPVKMFALNRFTGNTIWISPDLDSHPWSQISASPSIEDGKVFGGINSLEIVAPLIDASYPCCSFRGSAFALDVHTGAILWQTYTIPEQEHKNTHTAKLAYAGAGIKGSNPPVDLKSRLVFFGTGQFSMFPDRISACLQNEKENGIYPGESNFKCLEDDLYPDALLALNMDTGAIVHSMRASGVDGWNPTCAVNTADPNCPKPIGYDYDFSQAPILHQVGDETRIFSLQKSGIAWSLRASDGAFRWSRYMPTGLLGGGSWGCSHDRQQNGFVCQITGAPVVFLATQQQFTYNLADGTTICDASWWFLDAETGEVKWQTASPYARAGKQCPPHIENPYIRGMKIEGPNGAVSVSPSLTATVGKSCPHRDPDHPTSIENSEFAKSYGGQAIGNGIVYVTEMTGNMYALDSTTGDCLAIMHCDQGSIYGAPSLSHGQSNKDEIVSVGCGYGRLRKEWINKSGCEDGKCSITAFGLP